MKETKKFGKGSSVKKTVTRSGSEENFVSRGGGLKYNRRGAPKKTISGRSVTKKMRRR
jgi:hypothetical protein